MPQESLSWSQQDLDEQMDALKQNSFFSNNRFAQTFPNSNIDRSSGDGGIWGGIKNAGSWAGKNLSSIFDGANTLYGIYDNETFTKPMLRAQQARAADLWNTQKPMMKYNLASAQRNEGRADAYQVDLWNKLSRQDGEAERTYASGSPQVSYV
jgi:hypothetical protein